MEAVKDPVMLMELERELAGPDRDAALARHDGVLSRLDKRIEEAMREGLSPDEFAKVQQLKEANVLARKILRLTARVDGRKQNA